MFVRHYAAVRRLLAHVTRDIGEAEDLAQDVFLTLLRHRFDPARAHDVRRWLLRVALNRGLNAVRGGRRREGRERDAASPQIYDLEAAISPSDKSSTRSGPSSPASSPAPPGF